MSSQPKRLHETAAKKNDPEKGQEKRGPDNGGCGE